MFSNMKKLWSIDLCLIFLKLAILVIVFAIFLFFLFEDFFKIQLYLGKICI